MHAIIKKCYILIFFNNVNNIYKIKTISLL